jgi:hypothetical protein
MLDHSSSLRWFFFIVNRTEQNKQRTEKKSKQNQPIQVLPFSSAAAAAAATGLLADAPICQY